MLTEQFVMRCLKCGDEQPEIHGAIDVMPDGKRYQMVVYVQCSLCGAVEFIVKEAPIETAKAG